MSQPATDQMVADVTDRIEFARMLQMPRASFDVDLIAAVIIRLEQVEASLSARVERAETELAEIRSAAQGRDPYG